MWTLLILSLPTQNTTARMRAWRALKALGAAVLRDGVYVVPDRPELNQALAEIAVELRANGGTAHLLHTQGQHQAELEALFDRSVDYAALLAEMAACRDGVQSAAAPTLIATVMALQKKLDQLQAIDHLPGEASLQAAAAMLDLRAHATARLQPDEPRASHGAIIRRSLADYQGRLWATRARPWVDRLASAWLIRRFIDPEARWLWLAEAQPCPKTAVGFDFDGATFSHVGAWVTFEVLMASFQLETPALRRLGALVHRLDVGGAPVPEADGVERILAGMREAITDDDQLMLAAAGVFEGLWTAFERTPAGADQA